MSVPSLSQHLLVLLCLSSQWQAPENCLDDLSGLSYKKQLCSDNAPEAVFIALPFGNSSALKEKHGIMGSGPAPLRCFVLRAPACPNPASTAPL